MKEQLTIRPLTVFLMSALITALIAGIVNVTLYQGKLSADTEKVNKAVKLSEQNKETLTEHAKQISELNIKMDNMLCNQNRFEKQQEKFENTLTQVHMLLIEYTNNNRRVRNET